MRSTLSSFLIFATGAAIGAVVTWRLIEGRYIRIAQDEIDSMNEYYRNKYGIEEPEDTKEDPKDDQQIDIREYAKIMADQEYVNYSNTEKSEYGEVSNVEKPYVIPPEECGELEGYEVVTLYYHADGVLTDDQNEIVDDADDVVGADFSSHFGEYEDDSVVIRNDAKRVDYEILYDPSTYLNSINRNPHHAEV